MEAGPWWTGATRCIAGDAVAADVAPGRGIAKIRRRIASGSRIRRRHAGCHCARRERREASRDVRPAPEPRGRAPPSSLKRFATVGHQINCYIDHNDTSAIVRSILDARDCLIVHERSPVPRPGVVNTLLLAEGGTPWLSLSLVRREDLEAVRLNSVPEQSCWTVDVTRSPVIEFQGCYCDEEIIRRGRLYYVDSFSDDTGVSVRKSEEFRRWAKGLLSRVRRQLSPHGDGDYIGRGAAALASSGARRLVDV
jgi:hypothetical protein